MKNILGSPPSNNLDHIKPLLFPLFRFLTYAPYFYGLAFPFFLKTSSGSGRKEKYDDHSSPSSFKFMVELPAALLFRFPFRFSHLRKASPLSKRTLLDLKGLSCNGWDTIVINVQYDAKNLKRLFARHLILEPILHTTLLYFVTVTYELTPGMASVFTR